MQNRKSLVFGLLIVFFLGISFCHAYTGHGVVVGQQFAPAMPATLQETIQITYKRCVECVETVTQTVILRQPETKEVSDGAFCLMKVKDVNNIINTSVWAEQSPLDRGDWDRIANSSELRAKMYQVEMYLIGQGYGNSVPRFSVFKYSVELFWRGLLWQANDGQRAYLFTMAGYHPDPKLDPNAKAVGVGDLTWDPSRPGSIGAYDLDKSKLRINIHGYIRVNDVKLNQTLVQNRLLANKVSQLQ